MIPALCSLICAFILWINSTCWGFLSASSSILLLLLLILHWFCYFLKPLRVYRNAKCKDTRIYLYIYIYIFWDSLTLSPRLECSRVISAHYNLCLLNSEDSSASVSQVAGITGMYRHAWLSFVFLNKDGVLLCFLGWSRTADLLICLLGFPKCWDYRREPPCLALYTIYLP